MVGGKGETVMETKVGDRFKTVLDEADYIVRRIVHSMVVLESQDGKRQIVTGVSSLNIKSFYQKKEDCEPIYTPQDFGRGKFFKE